MSDVLRMGLVQQGKGGAGGLAAGERCGAAEQAGGLRYWAV